MNAVDKIIVNDDITLISLCDCSADVAHLADVFTLIAQADIDVDMISQFPPSGANSGFSFSVSDNDFVTVLPIAASLREKMPKTKISVSSGNSKLTITGENMNGTPGVAADVFTALAKAEIDVRMITTSENEISLLVIKSDVDGAVKAIKEQFSI